MALWICLDCSAAYAVGQSRCPNCRGTDYIEEGVMPKITVHGGPSNDADQTSLPDDIVEPAAPEEESSPGNSSETSSPKAAPKQQPNGSKGRSRARTTASPSDKAPTGSSTARGTGGAPTSDGGEG